MEQWWRERPWRMIQTNFREIDFAGATPEQFVADLRSFDANIVLLNAGGIIANYDSKLEFEPENPFRGGKSVDPLLDACHRAGIKVIARTDFSKILTPVYERHPDWAYRNRDGRIVNYNGYVQTCPNGAYQQEAVRRIIREMLTEHAFDGIFYNMGGFRTRDYSYNYYGPCHCDACKRKFRERFGLEIPTEENEDDPRYQKYRVFIRDCRDEHEESLAEYVKSIRPDAAIDGVDFQRIESNTELVRFRPQPPWHHSASSNTRCARDEERGIVSSNSSVDYIGFPYRHVSVSPELHELRLWQNLANLGGLDFFVISRLDNHRDTSGYANVRKVFRFAKEHEAEYAGLRSAAKVLLFRDEIWGEDAEIRGWIRALTEAHIPFDERLYPTVQSADMLARYDLVILPDIKYVPDTLAGILDEFAARGGAVLATGEAGMHDDSYAPRRTAAMACLGVEEILIRRKDALSAMFEIREQDREAFPGFVAAPFVAVGERLVHLRMKPGAKGYLRYIPPHRYGPPECCYFTDVTEEPGVFEHAHGKGRGILIPWLPGTFFYREGHRNAQQFLTDVLLHLCGAQSIAPDLTPMVETTLARGETGGRKKTVIQLVNNSGHFANSYYAPLPIHDISLVLRGAKPTGVRTLRGGKASFTADANGAAHISLDALHDFEAIVIDTEN